MTPTPSPPLPDERTNPRVVAAWDAWLRALATDAEAALAAASTYASLDPRGRRRWLAALAVDVPRLGVPRLAVYAPLLSVETEPTLIEKIREGLAVDEASLGLPAAISARALRGVTTNGARIVVLVVPVYLAFVRVIVCKFHAEEGFHWARHEPLVHDNDAPRGTGRIEGVRLEPTPLSPVVEELAHAVLAHRRRGQPLPEALQTVTFLFSPATPADFLL